MTHKVKSAGLEINSVIRRAGIEENLSVVDGLIKMSMSNAEFYKLDQSSSGVRLQLIFSQIIEVLEKSVPVIKQIESFAADYDLDEHTKGNGYRSFIYIFNCATKHTEKICRYITENRASLLFRKSLYMKEIEVCKEIFESLLTILENLVKMSEKSTDGILYSKEHAHDNLITQTVKVINQTCFYGRAIGFQYVDSLKPILRFLAVSMASFSEAYFSTGHHLVRSTSSLFGSSKYFLDPELCAQRIVNVTFNAAIDFCKSFWFLAEGKLMHTLPSLVGYKVEVNNVFKIPPEPLQVFSKKFNKMIDVPLPRSHTGLGSVSCRLLSAKRRNGMVGGSQTQNSAEPSKYLIIHSHGGGWVAQSSKSHELYLREWAVKLDVPILSIDYSLAPEAPFPRAFEDIFYTYCWILKNVELLGSTGENIVFAGDSAGGNLNTACVVKCIDLGIPVPKGLFNAYTPFCVTFATSPARFLSMVDPLLPYGFIMRVFKSYGAVDLEALDKSSSLHLAVNEVSSNHETIEDLKDDNQETELLSPESNKALEAMWNKIKKSSEEQEWQTNLGSIRETPSEEPSSPFTFPKDSGDDDDEGSPIRFLRTSSVDDPRPRGRLGSRTFSEENIVVDIGKETFSVQSIQNKIQSATNTFVTAITTPFKISSPTLESKRGNIIPTVSHDEFVFSVPNNHYLSPYLASDEVLKQFPRTKILSTNVDPCLDDCVEFSKKLRNLNVDVELDILEGLVHGFLNFAQVSKECHEASMICMQRIAELLGLEKEETS